MTDHVSSRKRGRDTTGGVTPATSNTVRTAGLILRESGGSSGSSDTSKRYDSSSDSSGGSSSSSSACLRKGMVILRGFLSAQEQTDLAAHVGRLGDLEHGGFYPCNNEKTKRMRMMNLGLKTDGKKHILQIPRAWTEVALRACRVAVAMDPSIPVLRPDICVVNHYSAASRLGWHQDLFSSRDPGLPVISLSLGNTATFLYRVSWKKGAATRSLRLEGGDALIFGGRSRGIIHAVPGIIHAAAGAVSTAVARPPKPDGASSFSAGVFAAPSSRAAAATAAEAEQEGSRRTDVPSPCCVVPGGGRFNLNFSYKYLPQHQHECTHWSAIFLFSLLINVYYRLMTCPLILANMLVSFYTELFYRGKK
ncbi:unnamed protein product [Pylaiella littoralis]